MSQSDFPTSFDVIPAAFDGIDHVDADTLNPMIQGARNCQLALEEKPYAPVSSGHGTVWQFPASVQGALQEMSRIEVGRIRILLPKSAGTVDVRLRNPGRFTKTNSNSVPMCVFAFRAGIDSDNAIIDPDSTGNQPVVEAPVDRLNYDGSGDVEGFRLNFLASTGDSREVEILYMAIEGNW